MLLLLLRHCEPWLSWTGATNLSLCVGKVLGQQNCPYSFSLCFLLRPWGSQSCPDLAQGQGSTNDVSLKVG